MTDQELVKSRYPDAVSRQPAAATGTLLTPAGVDQWGIYETASLIAAPLGFGTTEGAAWTDAVTARIKAVCRYFTRGLHRRIGLIHQAGIQPTPQARVNAVFIFASLEDSRQLFGKEEDGVPMRCRFSLGDPTEEEVQQLETLAHQSREVHFLVEQAKPKLEEYLVDYSFSVGTLEQLRSENAVPNLAKFKLMLIGESETSYNIDETIEDFPKLFHVDAPLKVMIYRGRSQAKAQKRVRDRFLRVFSNHSDFTRIKTAQWLFVGMPGYREWYDSWAEPQGLSCQVNILDSFADEPAWLPKDWWSWSAEVDGG